MLGRKLYEQFNVVVRLTTRVRVTRSVWVDLLGRAQHGECTQGDLETLGALVLTDARRQDVPPRTSASGLLGMKQYW